MIRERYPYYLASEALGPNADLEVSDKYTGRVVTHVARADAMAFEKAIDRAAMAHQSMRNMPAYERQAVLLFCARCLDERSQDLALVLCVEAGKPIRQARQEVDRAINIFRVAAEEAVRINGEALSLDLAPRTAGYRGFVQRVSIGPCSFITPFDFPLNLAAHKIAPAIAAGCPFVLRPSSLTPLSAMMLGDILSESELPRGAFSILPCHHDTAEILATDERLKLLSFTGSPEVGWRLKAKAGKKHVVMELGGNAACVVDSGVDLDDVVERVVSGSYHTAGQSCISVQRIIAHRDIYDRLRERLIGRVSALRQGDPRSEETDIGPMISNREASRLETWVNEAVVRGARTLCGGRREGTMFEPTLLEGVPRTCRLYGEEAFGPVAMLIPFDDFDAALQEVNRTRFGLQAGVFTNDLGRVQNAWASLEVGAVVINDVPSIRGDNMPYGGVKDSGLGREGVSCSINEMTVPRLLVLRPGV